MAEVNGVNELGEDITAQPEVPTKPVTAAAPDPTLLLETAKAQVMAQMAMDPDIRKILELRQQGKKIQVDEFKSEPTTAPAPSKPLNDMSNEELTQYMLQQVGITVSSVLDKKLAPVNDEFERMRQSVNLTEQQKIDQSIVAAKAKYKDFDQHVQAIQALANSGKFQGADVEDLYLLAKRRQNPASTIPQSVVATEVPENTPRVGARREEPVARGRAGFNQLLQKSLSKLDVSAFADQ